jgi:acyl dehydratase/NAD(P)-dependent dehydrogenase (short-subunit alcohol dehydrogenase family)
VSYIVASRVFSLADQALFAALSGDNNPIHLDPVIARRTGAGSLVVHGVHNLLWCLDCVAREVPDALSVASLRVNFDTIVTINERVDAVLVQCDAKRLRIEGRVRGILALTAVIELSDKHSLVPFQKPVGLIDPVTPIDSPVEEILMLAGRLPFATPPSAVAEIFPNAARMLGARRVTAIGAFTRLIGMVCPGLHSIFNSLSLESSNDDGADDIGFRVTNANMEHRRIVCAVGGGGWVGTLTSMIRHRPTAQPSVGEVARHLTPGEFSQSVAIIIGGSRGLGEAAAKIIAAGGGKPVITYATGQSDAQRVSAEIHSWGGFCDVMKLDVNLPIAAQLAAIEIVPNQLLYFATPMIGGRRAMLFDADRLEEFVRFYVTGFYNCCCVLIDKGAAPLTAFYPSTIFVENRPAGVTEYAMAKAAGEQLCRDMNLSFASFRALVSRLPRLATDQNPALSNATDHQSVCEVLVPIIRNMCGTPEVSP